MYDSHTHLTSKEILPNIEHVFESFENIDGKGILDVAFDMNSNFSVIELNRKYNHKTPFDLYVSLGLHPEVYYPNNELDEPITSLKKCTTTLKMIEDLIERNLDIVSSIGETGLDYRRIRMDSSLSLEKKEELMELQRFSFRKHVSMALKYDKPLTIHLRDVEGSDDAVIDVLKLLAEVGRGRVGGSFHSYTQSKLFIEDIQALGFKIGFNAIITYPSGKNVRDLLREAPIRNVLIESDAPYLPTQEKRRKKSERKYGEPADLEEIVDKIAEIKYLTPSQVVEHTGQNFLQIFG